ncbi:MAG: hypothetical protein SF339_13245 [Blastocatellia bacterium]|nr:hypothetical protein [Blastocatellia bacterium]
METQDREEFYVGYQPRAPHRLGAFLRRAAMGLLGLTAVVAAVLVFGQGRFAASYFEFGTVREYVGVLHESPYPFLNVAVEGAGGALPAFIPYALVAEGKRGADELVRGFDGKRVKLRGTLIHRDELRMIEVVGGSLQPVGADAAGDETKEVVLGSHTLAGEIVDSKCYLGVMNPGQAKPHRECAVRCISGGVPPLFVATDSTGRALQLWLVSASGEPVNRQVLDLVAEPIEIAGEVRRANDRLYLRADPARFRRLN